MNINEYCTFAERYCLIFVKLKIYINNFNKKIPDFTPCNFITNLKQHLITLTRST